MAVPLGDFFFFANWIYFITNEKVVAGYGHYYTHIDWHNSVTSVCLFPLGPVSDQKRGLFPSAMCFMTQLGLKCQIRTETWKRKEVL